MLLFLFVDPFLKLPKLAVPAFPVMHAVLMVPAVLFMLLLLSQLGADKNRHRGKDRRQQEYRSGHHCATKTEGAGSVFVIPVTAEMPEVLRMRSSSSARIFCMICRSIVSRWLPVMCCIAINC